MAIKSFGGLLQFPPWRSLRSGHVFLIQLFVTKHSGPVLGYKPAYLGQSQHQLTSDFSTIQMTACQNYKRSISGPGNSIHIKCRKCYLVRKGPQKVGKREDGATVQDGLSNKSNGEVIGNPEPKSINWEIRIHTNEPLEGRKRGLAGRSRGKNPTASVLTRRYQGQILNPWNQVLSEYLRPKRDK